MKEDVLAKTKSKDIDMNKSENLKAAKDIDRGYSTRAALRKCLGIKDIAVFRFRQDSKACLEALASKLLEKCPSKYPLTEALTFINPCKVAFSQDEAVHT